MKRELARILTSIGVVLACAALSAQGADRLDAFEQRIGRIFQAREFAVPRFGPARWMPGGSAYTTVEPTPGDPGSHDIVRYDAVTGARSVRAPGPRGDTAPLTAGATAAAWGR